MITYSDYLSETNTSEELMSWGGKRKRKEPRPIKEKRFNRIRDFAQQDLEENKYSIREEAEEALNAKIQQMGPLEFLIFRAMISWLVYRLLDIWFNKS